MRSPKAVARSAARLGSDNPGSSRTSWLRSKDCRWRLRANLPVSSLTLLYRRRELRQPAAINATLVGVPIKLTSEHLEAAAPGNRSLRPAADQAEFPETSAGAGDYMAKDWLDPIPPPVRGAALASRLNDRQPCTSTLRQRGDLALYRGVLERKPSVQGIHAPLAPMPLRRK